MGRRFDLQSRLLGSIPSESINRVEVHVVARLFWKQEAPGSTPGYPTGQALIV